MELELAAPDIAALAAFYGQLLELPVSLTADRLTVAVGASRRGFVQSPEGQPARYHVAFDVPENQIEAAAAWLRGRVPLLADSAGQELFYSDNWDAHNVYFYDPAGNVLELIARHTLPNASQRPFNSASLLHISEIGVCAADVRATVADIRARTGAGEYHGPGSAAFSPVGDDHGLLIVVQRGRIWFPETGVAAEPLPLAVTVVQDRQRQTLRFG